MSIELIKHTDGSVEAAMDVKPGDQALRATVRPAKNLPPEAISALPLICLKVIPDAEGGAQPSLAQLRWRRPPPTPQIRQLLYLPCSTARYLSTRPKA